MDTDTDTVTQNGVSPIKKRLFEQSAGPGLRAFVFLIISVVLLSLNQRSVDFHTFRTRFSSEVAYPFQWLVDAPIRFSRWATESLMAKKQLIHENEELRVNEILLQSRLQKLLRLEKENAQLRQLLQSTSQVSGKVAVARLLAVALDPNLQEVVLNKGARDQVYEGQPVLDAFGVVGQVIGVGSMTSRVLLITDKQSAVPVEDYRDGVRGIATGQGTSGQLALINIPDQSDIQVGDLFVTSGLGLCYPVGYPVGTVVKIEHVGNSPIEKIILTPTAHLNQTEQVLLAWPDKNKLSKEVAAELKSTQKNSTVKAAATTSTKTKKSSSASATVTTKSVQSSAHKKSEKIKTKTSAGTRPQ